MPKTFKGNKVFTTNFDVQTTRPLDVRLVVDSKEDLTNGSITAPYQGMVVNIAGTSELWILKTTTIEESYEVNEDGSPKNWELVTGSGSGSGLSKYSLPVMTPEMVAEAEADEDIDFDGSEDPYILVDDINRTLPTEGDVYMGLIRDMMGAIRSLQAEVARLRNTFDYGIDSYNNTRTAKGVVLHNLSDVEEAEPLWAIDPGYLSLVPDSVNFNTLLDINHSFLPVGDVEIDTSVDGELTFANGGGKFYDGRFIEMVDDEPQFDDYTLYKLEDSKLITYLVTDKPDITMTLVSLEDRNQKKVINFEPLLNGNTVNKYGFCVVISRKEKKTGKGFNYIYFSIINYENDRKLYEGYLNQYGRLSETKYELGDSERYSIESIEFDRLTLSRMKFYTKFEDFSEEVISSAPSESDYKYEVAHIAIRSVRDTEMLDAVADHLKDNELIWNKASGTLHIKSDGKVYTIGSNKEDDKQKDDNMTDKQIVDALKKMGIIVNVQYDEETDEIVSLSNISMAPIADVTFVNEDTDKKFTFSVDAEGNLIGKDKSVQTIEEFMVSIGDSSGKYDLADWPDGYEAYRGFSSDYLFRRNGFFKISSDEGVNQTADAGKKSDRLRISSFYAPIKTDERHGCTHSYIELENSSDKDIPLTGVYLHFYNPTENNYAGAVHHLALDGVIKAGGTYLIRGAKHAEFDDESAFIKVKTYDKEWYENKQLLSFEQEAVKTKIVNSAEDYAPDNQLIYAYRFCLTYGLPNLAANDKLVDTNPGTTTYPVTNFPSKILNPRYIDSLAYSTFAKVAKKTGDDNPWYITAGGPGIVITPNSLFRLTFALDPAKQAFNAFNKADCSRIRYNSANDIQVLKLDSEFIGYPFSKETIRIDRYTPKASFENKNVMTDKSQLNREKPNMVTCSFGVDVYNTRCFNWISCGTFDESVWIRVKNDENPNPWLKFDSYKKVSYTEDTLNQDNFVTTTTNEPIRKEYSPLVNNTVYARMVNRFPGNDVLFTAHKCVILLPDASEPTIYEYVVGRADKDGNPDFDHTNNIFTFTLYPRSYEGRVYQITDQQGFHWIEYQVWAASAEYLNRQITSECSAINGTETTKVFPILINTGDMTQSGARINEWLDYYNGGISLFDHLEQMNCVGNNDLCPINPRELGTGDDTDKSSSHFFHYFYCFDVKDTEKYASADADDKKFFSGETLIVRPHSGSVPGNNSTVYVDVTEDKYIPSLYYFKTKDILYLIVNSEIPISNCKFWFGLCSNYTDVSNNTYINIYTGIESKSNGNYVAKTGNDYPGGVDYFTPVYETMYAWLSGNRTLDENTMQVSDIRKVVVAMHEMPFTVITRASLANNKAGFLSSTRNHPNGKASRVGSNVNQLALAENRGNCWCSRLLEYFGCKLVIGGHKHTYALSYPIKEKYSWTYNGTTKYSDGVVDGKYTIKPMGATLADEAGNNPTYLISWDIDLSVVDQDDPTTNRNQYNVSNSVSDVGTSVKLNSTKTPLIPKKLYDAYGEDAFIKEMSGKFRCCTPIDTTSNPNYDGFVTYSMCQATGYKLKSNKELPWKTQVFSKIIPITDIKDGTDDDKPDKNQLYPMYSVLEYEYDSNNKISGISVTMNRISGIFASNGKDTFNQLEYGKTGTGRDMLCTIEKEDCDYVVETENDKSNISNPESGKTCYVKATNKIYTYSSGETPWTRLNTRMYGKWLKATVAESRLAAYRADQKLPTPTGVSDNRYLHIIF